MNISEIIQEAEACHLKLSVRENKLTVTGPADEVERWRPVLAGYREKLIRHLPPVATAIPAIPATEIRATGYGCGRCQANNYLQVRDGWKCQGCGAVFSIIGGSKGPNLTGYQQGGDR
jgi:hypothetical protein